jgi:UDP-N-acetyl-D-galactosamine dehydrogenase
MKGGDMNPKIAIIGLGYVGLPLAVSLAKHFSVTGFDVDHQRVKELTSGWDRTKEITKEQLEETTLVISSDPGILEGQDIFIVAVPTPVSLDNQPDMTLLREASKLVGRFLKTGAIVVFESTVYPGVTETICGPCLEETSGLLSGKDFYLGYSPERINPGDHEHTVTKVIKVVSGQTREVSELLAEIYGKINGGRIFVAKNIATAEAAKVIENAQRDINIAFVNEVAKVMSKLGLSVYDVLEAASTKWNFLPFHPGLVGGHCVGVDPYYLSSCALQAGITPEIILAGRHVNESMSQFIAQLIMERTTVGDKILVLGVTFKENIPDLRNTKVVDVITSINKDRQVWAHDVWADKQEAENFYGLHLISHLDDQGPYDLVLAAVAHDEYLSLSPQDFQKLLKPGGWIVDLKGIWRKNPWENFPQINYITL